MWSASSSTEISTADSVQARLSMRSISRPGVATTTSTPRFSASICLPYEAPPNTQASLSASDSPSGRSSSATWVASSRVGTNTRARGAFGVRLEPDDVEPDDARRASIGKPNASVLPPPVCARPSTSRPARTSGIARAWIANGASMPFFDSASTSGFGKPSAVNVVAFGVGMRCAASSAASSSDAREGLRGDLAVGGRRRAGDLRGLEWLFDLRTWVVAGAGMKKATLHRVLRRPRHGGH